MEERGADGALEDGVARQPHSKGGLWALHTSLVVHTSAAVEAALLHASVGLGDADEAAQLRCAAAMTLDSASLDAVYDDELSECSGALPLMRSFGSSIPSIVLEDSVAAPAQAPPAPVPPPMRTAQSCCCNGEYSSPAKFGAVSASSSFGAAAPELGRAATFSSLFEQRLRELLRKYPAILSKMITPGQMEEALRPRMELLELTSRPAGENPAP